MEWGSFGFNFLKYVNEHYPQYKLACLDAMTYAAEPFLDEKVKYLDDNKIQIYKYDICDPKISFPIGIENVDTIVNFAAETHVDNSITDPGVFITSNIVRCFQSTGVHQQV